MKKLVLSIVCLLCLSIGLFASNENDGIHFFDGTYEEALEKAKRENKLIFIDFWATWCGPCKVMANTVFKEKVVGDFYNQNFINLKVCVNRGEEGIALGKRFNIVGYPTFMFLNNEGFVVLMDAGSKDAQGLIKLGEKALNLKTQIGLEERFIKGERDTCVVYNYLKQLADFWRFEKVETVLEQLFVEQQENFFNDSTLWKTFEACAINPETSMAVYFVTHRKKMCKKYGIDVVDNKIFQLYAGLESVRILFPAENQREKFDSVGYIQRKAHITKRHIPHAKMLISCLDFVIAAREAGRGLDSKRYKNVVNVGEVALKNASAEEFYIFSVLGEFLVHGRENRDVILKWAERGKVKLRNHQQQQELDEVIKDLKTLDRPRSGSQRSIIRFRENPFK